MKKRLLLLLVLFIPLKQYAQEKIDLSGKWEFAMNSPEEFQETVMLPGTMVENEKGIKNEDKEQRLYLSREFMFKGKAYYQREIVIPKGWSKQRIALVMGRTRKTKVWLDGELVGANESFSARHVYTLGSKLKAGVHTLLIEVDNSLDNPPGTSHANREDTQTNWNGIVGDLYLEATPLIYIEKIRISTDIFKKQAKFAITISNVSSKVGDVSLSLSANSFNSAINQVVDRKVQRVACSADGQTVEMVLQMPDDVLLWDEFTPNLYKAKIGLNYKGAEQIIEETFGMCEFVADGKQFTINGKKIMLRGKHDACVFPLTGYAPMDVDEWVRVLRIAKSWGINHYRFHTWCPPEEALEAADIVGIYMQPELPLWGALAKAEKGIAVKDINEAAFGAEKTKEKKYDPSVKTDAEIYFAQEGKMILDQMGNHPSFTMFALGNELWGSMVVMQRLVDTFRDYDENRRLYAQGSNNNFRSPLLGATDDYWTTVRTSEKTWKDYDNIVRSAFSVADQYDCGPINHYKPSTRVNFSEGITNLDVPVIGHETGQYQYYPDFDEIHKYTGVMKPWNLLVAENIAKEKEVWSQRDDFYRAAGVFASILYCEENEAAIRTPGFGGFQLLDLQDFPGQGTALVGPLNAFMESKGCITNAKWKEFCSAVTILAEFDEFTLTAGDNFSCDVKIANYGSDNIIGKTLRWTIGNIATGNLKVEAPQGMITELGKIEIVLPKLTSSLRTDIKLEIEGGEVIKSYPLWIYPTSEKIIVPKDVKVVREMTPQVRKELQAGKKILYMPNHAAIKEHSVGGLFMTDFWSYPMFLKIAKKNNLEPSPGTMGLLINDNHPALKGFPTEYHSNWQWWLPVKNSRPIILDNAPRDCKPIVQTIDNMWRSHKLGTLFEFKVGKGKLLVSAIDLEAIKGEKEGAALYQSILDYMGSELFSPTSELNIENDFGQLIMNPQTKK